MQEFAIKNKKLNSTPDIKNILCTIEFLNMSECVYFNDKQIFRITSIISVINEKIINKCIYDNT